MLRELRVAFVMLLGLTLLTGVAYPLVVTGAAQLIFPRQATGSLIQRDGKLVGSDLLGQAFTGDKYFHGRPSAAGGVPYNGLGGAGSNLGPTNPALAEAVGNRVEEVRKATGDSAKSVPVDLVTSSASGLDPHISPAAALLQVPRIARVRGMSEQEVETLVGRHIEGPTWGLFGAPRVNVLRLNLALDASPR
ncbi:MAG: potassium-transporting ATPase subunit C [Pirellula sp.]|nr:potassium-transporting ATPase subunit C [Pirellula sp.]